MDLVPQKVREVLIRQRDAGNGTFVRLRRDELATRFPGLIDLIVNLTSPTNLT